jgi:7-keto-8-aminopelargonate synthetase-like enzyme
VSLTAPLQQIDRTFVRHGSGRLAYFGGCDYFRLASHPAVLRALQTGLEKYGLNVAASRSTTGNHALFGKLEAGLRNYFGVGSAALLSSGYVANMAFTQSFANSFTHALLDARAHGSLLDAAEFLRCPRVFFQHRDVHDLQQHLEACGRAARPLIMTDGLFSHDGSVAPVKEYAALLPKRGILLIDDAHGAGTLGRTGRGTLEICGVRDDRIVQCISMSKAFGVYGGAVLGAGRVIAAIQERSHMFKGNTPLPLPLAHAALEALRILRKTPGLRARLNENTGRIKDQLTRAHFAMPENRSPIVALIPRTARHAARISSNLLGARVFPTLIRYADGPRHGYFRFAISSEHTGAQLDSLASALIASMD